MPLRELGFNPYSSYTRDQQLYLRNFSSDRLSPEEAKNIVEEVESKKKRLKKLVIENISSKFKFQDISLSSKESINLQKDQIKSQSKKPEAKKTPQNQYNQTNCTICLNNFENQEELLQINQCNHAFHEKCLEDWMTHNMKCPLCNKRPKIRAKQYKEFMTLAKESQDHQLDSQDRVMIDEMLSKDTAGKSYSVNINVSDMVYHRLDSSIHYAQEPV